MRKTSKLFLGILLLAGAGLASPADALTLSTVKAYLYADGMAAAAFDERLYSEGSFGLGAQYADSGLSLDFSLTSLLGPDGLGTFNWRVQNNGAALTNARFVSLLYAPISFGSDSATANGRSSGFEINNVFVGFSLIDKGMLSGLQQSSGDLALALGFGIGRLARGGALEGSFSLSAADNGGLHQFDGADGFYYNGSVSSDSTAPVPEPGSLLLVGLGLVGLVALRRRNFHFRTEVA
jgi:hypothetical protein